MVGTGGGIYYVTWLGAGALQGEHAPLGVVELEDAAQIDLDDLVESGPRVRRVDVTQQHQSALEENLPTAPLGDHVTQREKIYRSYQRDTELECDDRRIAERTDEKESSNAGDRKKEAVSVAVGKRYDEYGKEEYV